MNLREASVLVTGGSSGIGRATAQLLVSGGAKVAICGRNETRLREAADATGAKPVVADVSIEEDVVRLVREVVSADGDYNVLINNAGYGYFAPLLDTDAGEMRRQYATNVFGAMMVARESARHFISRGGGGSIVNVASTAAERGFAGGTSYASSKFALRGMTECWRAELRKHDIRVMEINPSEVITEFFETAGRTQSATKRKLHAEDIAHAIVSMLTMHDRGFVTEMSVWATNP